MNCSIHTKLNYLKWLFLSTFCFSYHTKGVISFWRARAGSEIVRLARKRARYGKAGLKNSAEHWIL